MQKEESTERAVSHGDQQEFRFGFTLCFLFVVCKDKEVTAAYFLCLKKNTRVGRLKGASRVQRHFCWETTCAGAATVAAAVPPAWQISHILENSFKFKYLEGVKQNLPMAGVDLGRWAVRCDLKKDTKILKYENTILHIVGLYYQKAWQKRLRISTHIHASHSSHGV